MKSKGVETKDEMSDFESVASFLGGWKLSGTGSCENRERAQGHPTDLTRGREPLGW